MTALYELFLQHPIACKDTRAITPGCLYFALKGERFDGNDFAAAALEKGAAAVVTDRKEWEGTAGMFYVPNVLTALQELAHEHRMALGARGLRLLVLTGTNGKTTTKNLITAVLATRYRVTATTGNLNNHIGVPLTLLSMTPQTEIGVVEMGASHPGEIAELAAIAAPDMGLVTNVGEAHLEGFGSLEGVMATKGALYDALIARKGLIFFNADNALLAGMLAERITLRDMKALSLRPYGLLEEKAALIPQTGERTGLLSMELEGYPVMDTQLAGAYNADNVLAALAVGRELGVDPVKAAAAVAAYEPDIRSKKMRTSRNDLIVDAYNANATSMAAALAGFAALDVPAKVCILGEMKELGMASARIHQEVVDEVRRMDLADAYWVGEGFRSLVPAGRWFATTADLHAYLAAHPLEGCWILLKGSNSNRLDTVVEVL